MNPSMDSKNIGHQKINLGFGINYINNNEFLKNHRLGLEIILPIYQKVRGIQMSETYKIMIVYIIVHRTLFKDLHIYVY